MKRPAFQFYPADWRKDTALQSCCLEARGLWHEMLCLMHECEPYGHLAVNGNPMKPAQIARLVGISPKEYQVLLDELTAAGVPSSTEDGTIYSRRMVRDEHIRNVRAQAGKLGGNPNLLVGKDKQKDKQNLKQKPDAEDNREPTPSSASSSSASLKPSVPNGTDADASQGLTAHEAIFQIGLPWIVSNAGSDVKESNIRSMLGGAEKHLKPEGAWQLVQDCMRVKPLQPVAWLAGAINDRKKVAPETSGHRGKRAADGNDRSAAAAAIFGPGTQQGEVIDV
jgi:hypothetical protein